MDPVCRRPNIYRTYTTKETPKELLLCESKWFDVGCSPADKESWGCIFSQYSSLLSFLCRIFECTVNKQSDSFVIMPRHDNILPPIGGYVSG